MWRNRKKKAAAEFNNVPTLCAIGHSHRSKLESSVCQMLQNRERGGHIKLVQAEDHIYLTKARIHYIPDFKCQDVKTGLFFWVEAKGYANEKWPMKKKLWKFYGPGPLEIWMGSHTNPKLVETIYPTENTNEQADRPCPTCALGRS